MTEGEEGEIRRIDEVRGIELEMGRVGDERGGRRVEKKEREECEKTEGEEGEGEKNR